MWGNFNPRSTHGERPISSLPVCAAFLISTHAPRTGSDGKARLRRYNHLYFNPRSPHGERLFQSLGIIGMAYISTHAPRTGSDTTPADDSASESNFNPRSPHGERPDGEHPFTRFDDFNPRSPHGERLFDCVFHICAFYFNPRSPHGERPEYNPIENYDRTISTHAPRTGSDRLTRTICQKNTVFQPTLPARGATFTMVFVLDNNKISTHAPRTGSDSDG